MEKLLKFTRLCVLSIAFCQLIGCGNLKSFSKLEREFRLRPGQSVAIVNYDCNRDQCQNIANKLHQNIRANLVTFLKDNQLKVVPKTQKHHYEILVITAHEEKIQHHHPRNVHVIIRDQEKKEYLQIGIAEQFSTPMTHQYIELSKVSQELHQHLIQHIEKPVVALAE